MKKILYALFICFISIIGNTQEIEKDQLITTNLTDSLKTKVQFRKSRNIDVDRLTRLSRITDLHKRSRLKYISKCRIEPLSVKKIVYGPKLNINGQNLYLNNLTLENPFETSNLYIDRLITSFNLKHNYNINTITLNNNIIGFSNTQNYQINQISINNLYINDMTIDKVYVIDNSIFNVVMTQKVMDELKRDTNIYKFETTGIFNIVQLKDLKKLTNEEYYKWIETFYAYSNNNIEYLKNTHIPKIIGEAHIENGLYETEDKNNLKTNLTILKKRGYDTVLVRFHNESDIDKTIEMINDIKSLGFKVYSTYVGLDSRPLWNPFILSPEKTEELISKIAPLSDGWLLNWRSISAHNKILPKEYFNFMCNIVRKYNEKCYIYGEVYYGEIGPLRTNALMYTTPTNITGIIVNNFGYYGYNHAYVINKLLLNKIPNYKQLQKIGQVIGYSPYYCSSHNLNLTVNEEYKYKEAVEKKFNKVRCGTLTFLHDGIDDFLAGEYNKYDTCDNIVYDIKIQDLK